MNTAASLSNPNCIYVPAGNYMTQPTNPGGGLTYAAKGFGCCLGDEHYNTNIFMMPNYAGDLFAWQSVISGAQQAFGNTQTFSNTVANTAPPIPASANKAGSSFRNITIIGNRETTVLQTALGFHGPAQFIYIDNCVVSYVRGIALGGGLPGIGGASYIVESRIQNCHFDHDGDDTGGTITPAVEFTSAGSEQTNSLDLSWQRTDKQLGPRQSAILRKLGYKLADTWNRIGWGGIRVQAIEPLF